MRDISYRVALGGIVSSLCLLCMFLSGIMPMFYLILPMIAGILLMIIAEEVNLSWAWLTYIAVGILSLFITADKEASLVFIMIFGHFPIIRLHLEKIKLGALRWLIKLIIFNICAVSFFYVTVYIFGIQQMLEEMNEMGRYGAVILLVLCNIIFVLYDLNLYLMYGIYKIKLMPLFKRKR
ncbi:MAG: hypothetical protein NC340_06605 [Ruminococcus flavefaciens]|nr:hypothetical protein [Ruminococcus flavefaciens]MCM1229701.1 hypothetical protein [Ruminococcus flavefaciens]